MPVYPLLAILWAMVLLPPVVRRRLRHRDEKATLRRMQMRVVQPDELPPLQPPWESARPVRRTPAQRRRRVLAAIGAAVGVTLVVAVVVRSRLAWGAHLLTYDLLLAYLALLARSADYRAGRRRRPASFPRLAEVRAPAPVLLPAASSR